MKQRKTYSRKEAIEASLEYFNGDMLAATVWVNKYALKNSSGELFELTPDDMHKRIARELYRIESGYPNPVSESKIYNLLKEFKFLVPAGSPMSGIGNNLQVSSISNCFVAGNEADSYGGILKTDEQLVQLMKRRGGVGTDLSHIRPSKTPVHNAALTSSGMVSFMDRYSNSTREVAQDGRRGALMLSVSIKHPDAEQFIDAKLKEGKVTGANISVRVTDEFMECVKADKDFIHVFPVDYKLTDNHKSIIEKTEYGHIIELEGGVYARKNRAQKLWDKIIHNAWKSAEPGVLFWDTIIRESLPDCYSDLGFKTTSTNPCQPEWATVLTPRGIRQFKDIKVGDKIWGEGGWTKVISKKSSGVKDVYRYKTTAGEFIGTENHRVISNGMKVEVKDADSIDVIAGECDSMGVLNKMDIIDGLLIGDGSAYESAYGSTVLYIGKKDHDYFQSEIADTIIHHLSGYKKTTYVTETTLSGDELPRTFLRKVPCRFVHGDSVKVRGFLRGLFSANGSVVGKRVTLKTSSEHIRDQVQVMLSSVGIRSYYTTNKPTTVNFSNGDYRCKESYDINISTDRDVFFEKIGFLQRYKMEKLEKYVEDTKDGLKTHSIVSKEHIGREEVFNITVSNKTHTYWTGGLNVSNCGEIPLPPMDSCRLLAINLFSYVKNPFTSSAMFDFDMFREHVCIAQRMMDNIVDLELEKVERIIQKIEKDPEGEGIKRNEIELWKGVYDMGKRGRRTGLGITAEGDMLAALGFQYGTKEATKFSEVVHETLAVESYKSSAVMAQERGVFEIYNAQREMDNPFLNRLKGSSPELELLVGKYGRRNIGCLTIAPTGSTSIMTQTTSGVEPVFLPVYKRRRKVNPGDDGARVDFIDETGDAFEEYVVFHHKFKDWMDTNNIELSKNPTNDEINHLVKQSPYFNATANDVDWIEKVEMQGAIQKWVDHSISVTVNLPEHVDESLVSKVYMKAWESGCKGMTIYRDGSRSGVLVSNDDKKKEDEVFDYKRPKRLKSEIVRFQNNKEKWVAFIGVRDNKPYEIFTGMIDNEHLNIPPRVTSGHIVKRKVDGVGVYDFEYVLNGKVVVVPELSRQFNKEYWNYAKLISANLRHNMPVELVVKQVQSLSFDNDNINSWKNGVGRALKRYIEDGKKASGQKCNSCGQESLVYQEGCLTCLACGNSKCG